MNTAPSNAATNASARKCPAPSASEVPTSTGATAAGSVRKRAAINQMRTALGPLGIATDIYARRGKREKSGLRFCL
jgi:hypothetical protein